MQVTDGHLGGYIAGGDPATMFPELWQWLIDTLGVRSVLDVGCGDGTALRWFEERLGSENVVGIDGMPNDHPRIVQWDYVNGPLKSGMTAVSGLGLDGLWITVTMIFDLVWCCEFVEHVEERHVPAFLADLKRGRFVLLTHAEPGQAGWHHVNCRPRDYWVGAMAATGFSLDPDLTLVTREYAALNTNPYNHYTRSGLAFRNNNT